jgi:CBS domain containing-hemolysin-like protein
MSEAAGSPPLLKRLLQLLRGEDPSSAAMRESLEEVIEESERKEAALSQQERIMLTNLLAFGETKVSDVMVPRAQILAVDEDTPMAELVAMFRDAKHSRLPVATPSIRGFRSIARVWTIPPGLCM